MTETQDVLVGIDIGTTNFKVLASEPSGRVIRIVRGSMVIDRPSPGAAEFDLDALDRDLLAALTDISAALGDRQRVAAIGVASIGESFVGLDAAGNRITKCPTWYDARTLRGRSRLGLTTPEWYDITGMVDDDIYTVHRLLWLRDQEPARVAAVASWLTVADYVVYRLTNSLVSAPSIAARTGLADRNTLDWSLPILDAAGVSRSAMPELRPAASVAGHLLESVARCTNLTPGIPVVNAGQDHSCASLACGLVMPGQALDSTGTSESLKTIVPIPLRFDETAGGSYDCYPHVIPNSFQLSCHIPTSGGLIDWLIRLASGTPLGAELDPAILGDAFAEAAQSPPGANGVRVQPFFEGTGPPLNDRGRRGVFSGLSTGTTRGDMVRATLEALAAWLASNVTALEALSGHAFARIILAGGGARSELSTAIKAAMLRRPFDAPRIDEAAALGAALVGAMAVGLFPDGETAANCPAIAWRSVEPDESLVVSYRDQGFGADPCNAPGGWNG